jgi:hypothetical protein
MQPSVLFDLFPFQIEYFTVPLPSCLKSLLRSCDGIGLTCESAWGEDHQGSFIFKPRWRDAGQADDERRCSPTHNPLLQDSKSQTPFLFTFMPCSVYLLWNLHDRCCTAKLRFWPGPNHNLIIIRETDVFNLKQLLQAHYRGVRRSGMKKTRIDSRTPCS